MSFRIPVLPPSHYANEVPLIRPHPVFVPEDTDTNALNTSMATDMMRLRQLLLNLKEEERKFEEDALNEDSDSDDEKKKKNDEEITYDNLISHIEKELRVRGITDTRLRLYKNDSMSRPAVAIVLPGETPLEILGQAIKHIEKHLEATSSQTKLRDLLAERDALRLQLQKVEECIQRLEDKFSLN